MFEGKRNAENYKREMERIYIKLSTEELMTIKDKTLKTASKAGKEGIDRREEAKELRSFLDMSIIELHVIDKIISIRKHNEEEKERRRLEGQIGKYKNKRPRRLI